MPSSEMTLCTVCHTRDAHRYELVSSSGGQSSLVDALTKTVETFGQTALKTISGQLD